MQGHERGAMMGNETGEQKGNKKGEQKGAVGREYSKVKRENKREIKG